MSKSWLEMLQKSSKKEGSNNTCDDDAGWLRLLKNASKHDDHKQFEEPDVGLDSSNQKIGAGYFSKWFGWMLNKEGSPSAKLIIVVALFEYYCLIAKDTMGFVILGDLGKGLPAFANILFLPVWFTYMIGSFFAIILGPCWLVYALKKGWDSLKD